jgi:ribosomal protein S18 acetylase RimI-like enzyme
MSAQPSSQDCLAAALEFERQTLVRVVDEVRAIDQGWVVRAPSFPEVWVFNNLRIHVEVTYEEALKLCARHLPDADFDQILILDNRVGERLAEVFRGDGWEVDVDVHSVLSLEPDRLVDTDAVVEAGEEEALDLMERWMKEDPSLHLTGAALGQLRNGNRLSWRARHARRLGIRDQDERLVAMTLLYSDGRVAQVEDVYVIPEARGRGYGRVLVTRAVDLARRGGHELTFIVADDNDWPKQLYHKLGFEPVGRTWLFHRKRPAAP